MDILTFCEVAVLIDYLRVSTDNRNLDLQKDAFANAGCDLTNLKLSRFTDKRKEVSE
jgi:DNA invertase Pin-like site-specific DNA recombinase